jgi:uncharacterized RDD family membrane protein YckC
MDGIAAVGVVILSVVIRLCSGMASYGVFIGGIVVAAVYLLLKDGLPRGQSLGSRLAKIAVVDQKTGAPCTFRQSFIRNLCGHLPILRHLKDRASETVEIERR